jgi:hypothetical protein
MAVMEVLFRELRPERANGPFHGVFCDRLVEIPRQEEALAPDTPAKALVKRSAHRERMPFTSRAGNNRHTFFKDG